MENILSYLKQASTYRGLTFVAGALGYYVDPTALDLIASVVGGTIGLIEIVRNENKSIVSKVNGPTV